MVKITTTNGKVSGAITMLVDEKLIYERQVSTVIKHLYADFPNTRQLVPFGKRANSLSNYDAADAMNGENLIRSSVDILTDDLCSVSLSVISYLPFIKQLIVQKIQIKESKFYWQKIYIRLKIHRISNEMNFISLVSM